MNRREVLAGVGASFAVLAGGVATAEDKVKDLKETKDCCTECGVTC